MSEFVEQAAALGAENYKNGINCAEAIITTFDKLCHLGIGEQVKMASGFGGGIGQCGDLCGALSGCVMVLGSFGGRPHPPEGDRAAIYALAKGFYQKFIEVNQVTDCIPLRKFDSGTREQRINCLKLVSNTAKLLAEYLEEKGLVKEQ